MIFHEILWFSRFSQTNTYLEFIIQVYILYIESAEHPPLTIVKVPQVYKESASHPSITIVIVPQVYGILGSEIFEVEKAIFST